MGHVGVYRISVIRLRSQVFNLTEFSLFHIIPLLLLYRLYCKRVVNCSLSLVPVTVLRQDVFGAHPAHVTRNIRLKKPSPNFKGTAYLE